MASSNNNKKESKYHSFTQIRSLNNEGGGGEKVAE